MTKWRQRAVSSTMNKRAPAERIPWAKLAWGLAIAVLGAWAIGFVAGLFVKFALR